MCQRGVIFMILHSSRVSGSWRIFTSGRRTWLMGFKFSSEDFPEDVKLDSLDGLCSVQSRHVQANCKFQVQQCKEGVSLLGQTLYAPTSRLHEIDVRIFSSPCYIHVCQACPDDPCFHWCLLLARCFILIVRRRSFRSINFIPSIVLDWGI